MDHIIIDGFGLVFRSHFAFSSLQTSTGLLSGCIFGFLVSARTIKKRFPHCHVTIAWDNDPVRRKKVFAGYKANRSRLGIYEQIDDLKEIFSNLNVSQSEYIGEEADDVIASLIKCYDGQIYIYSSDKDMFQLVKDGRVIVIRPKRGRYEERYFDEEAVKEAFKVSSENFVCFQCFRGDKVDSVPGVPRLPSDLIARLSEKYKTPQNIYDNLDEEKLTEFQRTSLLECRDQVLLNDQLVKLRNDLDLEIMTGKPNAEALVPLFDKYDINSLKSNSYVEVFIDEPSFTARKAPALVVSYPSLFEGEN
jgi:DNA polymerase-1